MKKSETPSPSKNTISFLNKNISPAQRLLDKLKSPHLSLASNLTSTQNPKSHVFLVQRQISQEVERLSGGRFSLAKNQKKYDELPSRYTPMKMVCHICQNYSFINIGLLLAYEANPEKCCCYCEEPLSLEHIGNTIAEVQRFVQIRSGSKVLFNPNNRILGGDLTDIFSFNCLNPCKGLHYEIPFAWFLRESRPLKSFSVFKLEHTCGCPSCTDDLIQKTTKSS